MLVLHYRKLIPLLLFATASLAQKPAAPFHDPNDPDDPRLKQEVSGTAKAGSNGVLVIPFIPAFRQSPSCKFEGDTLPGEAPKQDRFGAKLRIKKHGKVRYECHGIKSE